MGERLDNAKAIYLEGIRDGDITAIERYAGGRYTQHSTPVRDGTEGFKEFFADFIKRNPIRDIQIVRGFEDGHHVFVQAVQNLNNGEFRYVTADIFDTDDDAKLIEHWDIIAELVDQSVSGHGQVDGPTEPTDLDKTEQNKRLVAEFLDVVLVDGHTDAITDYVSTDTLIQHNPQIGDGVDAMRTFLDGSAGGGPMRYEKVHLVIGCGDLVAALSKADLAGTDIAIVDLFRVADGRIVEHWDVTEAITPEETWVNSGKF